MSNFETWLIIILVIGVIASNLAVLKYSAKFKMTQFGKDTKPSAESKQPIDAKEETTPSDQNSVNTTTESDNASKTANTDTDDKSGSST